MKKLWILLGFCIVFGFTAMAASGDISGAIYATDITAIINGVTVPSYNIGGRTVVIVEDITEQHYYNDSLRTLIIGSLAPDALVAGANAEDKRPVGTKIGNTYETDIVTFLYDTELPCYSLNGKMAVAIEDLGGDNTYTKTGGKYIWDAEARTITLETIYEIGNSITDIMREKHVSLVSEDGVNAQFVPQPIMHGGVSGLRFFEGGLPKEILVDGRIIGYSFYPKNSVFFDDGNGNISLSFEYGTLYTKYYHAVVEEILCDVIPVQPKREDWLAYFEGNMMTVLDSLETEEYTFLYTSQPNFHGASQFLIRITADGTVQYYDAAFESVSLHGQKYFDNVTIDREKEIVSFRYDRDYVIDLKTGEMQ